ncbi:hypothetical protein [Psychrobacillus sp. FSL K6-1464]
MTAIELNDEFKKILEYGYILGNENKTIKANEFIDEMSAQLKVLFERTKE